MTQPKTVVLGICGGIAAYKACELASRLRKKSIDVYPIMTKSATSFITPLTLQTICARPVAVNLFSTDFNYDVEHISLARKADVFAVVPATANVIGKMANGIADDMLTTTVMATKAPILIAPAMNTVMYESEAMQKNLSIIEKRGCTIVGPDSGLLVCGETGKGRLASIDDIESSIMKLLFNEQDLKGVKIMVTAGPTREFLDPVRYITNRSSGRMGYAIAKAARDRGAKVTLISGPVNIDAPSGVEVIPVVSTNDMLKAAIKCFENCDIAIKAAAPADYAPKEISKQKIKKSDDDSSCMSLDLIENIDIAKELGKRKGNRVLVGFAAETQFLEDAALKKLKSKNLDMIVANDVTKEGAGFDTLTNIVTMFTKTGVRQDAGPKPKEEIAHLILDLANQILGDKQEH